MRARLAAAVFCVLGAVSAHAACSVSVGPLSFGPYDPLSPAGATTSGVITVTCDQSPPPIVTVQIGPSAVSGGFFPRRMQRAGGSDTLDYNLYADPGLTAVWGDGTAGTAHAEPAGHQEQALERHDLRQHARAAGRRRPATTATRSASRSSSSRASAA